MRSRAAPKDPRVRGWLMSARSQSRSASSRKSKVIEDIDLAEITTIHGFYAALRQMAFEAGMLLERELLHDVTERIRTRA